MERVIGWGVIGCGDVVMRKSGAALGAAPGSRLVAIMRRDAVKLREAAQLLKAPVATTNAAEVIAHPDVSAVYIATPPQDQLGYALAVARAGKACLVEKPAGRSDRELEQMMQAFVKAGAPLYVSYYRRHLARSAAIKEILRSGRLGPLVSVDYRLAKVPRETTWRLSAQSGGGHFHDLAGHVLDLFDDWFGPLELMGASAGNVLAGHETEDAVTLSFRAADGLVGAASWDFAATEARDELVIEGLRGSLRLAAMSRAGPVVLTVKPPSEAVIKSFGARLLTRLRGRHPLRKREHLRFDKEDIAHLPLVRSIVEGLRSGAAPATPSAALRSSRLVNQALERYYGGRSDDFWNHPERFDNARARASQRTAREAGYGISPEEIARFDDQGYLGPFRCDGDWRRIAVPLKRRRDVHLRDPSVFDVCTHPSVVRRAAQLLRLPRVALFKSRFFVKFPGHNEEVPWHQDVGAKNGGYYPDGRPVPSVTCWIALDRVSAENGAVQVLPGSHKRLIGDFRRNFHAELLKNSDLSAEDLASAVTLSLEPGEFYLFHSWLIHGSAPNLIAVRRAGLNMRYVAPADCYEAECQYIPLDCAGPGEASTARA